MERSRQAQANKHDAEAIVFVLLHTDSASVFAGRRGGVLDGEQVRGDDVFDIEPHTRCRYQCGLVLGQDPSVTSVRSKCQRVALWHRRSRNPV